MVKVTRTIGLALEYTALSIGVAAFFTNNDKIAVLCALAALVLYFLKNHGGLRYVRLHSIRYFYENRLLDVALGALVHLVTGRNIVVSSALTTCLMNGYRTIWLDWQMSRESKWFDSCMKSIEMSSN